MPAYALAIFDFDGTLADSFPWFRSVLDQIAAEFDLRRVKPEEIDDLRDLSSREVLSYLGVPAWKLPAIAIHTRKLAADGLSRIPLYPGAAEALAALHRAGVKLAVVSSNAEDNIRTVLGPAAGIIDHYACGSSLWGKSEKFRSVLNAFGQRPNAAVAIGDEVRDIEAARRARLAVGTVTFGYNSRKALAAARPDFLFDSYDELVRAMLA